ncbi:MAG: 7-carboxy-7-deazaguanine synthase QueE [Bacteroidota bacterium]
MKLPVRSIFESINGEVGYHPQGSWTTFIRLQGCNLSCKYCDTKHTQRRVDPRANEMSPKEIAGRIRTRFVTITGGEPLIHKTELEYLATELYQVGISTQIETNGSIVIPEWTTPPVGWVIDQKGPASGMEQHNLSAKELVRSIKKSVQFSIIKFVVDTDIDLMWAMERAGNLMAAGYHGMFAFSPVDADPARMTWILDTLKMCADQNLMNRAVFSLQIHKTCDLP